MFSRLNIEEKKSRELKSRESMGGGGPKDMDGGRGGPMGGGMGGGVYGGDRSQGGGRSERGSQVSQLLSLFIEVTSLSFIN